MARLRSARSGIGRDATLSATSDRREVPRSSFIRGLPREIQGSVAEKTASRAPMLGVDAHEPIDRLTLLAGRPHIPAMLIDHDRQFIFVHIPKTAGQSVSAALGHPKNQKPHSIKQHLLRENPSYLRFCFVRNPWDRLASAFFYSKRMVKKGVINNDRVRIYLAEHPDVTFEQFVTDFVDEDIKRKSVHFREQVYWIDRTSPHFIGRFESMQEHFAWLTRIIGIDAELPQLNASGSVTSYSSLYTPQAIEKVAAIYAADVGRLGYARPKAGKKLLAKKKKARALKAGDAS